MADKLAIQNWVLTTSEDGALVIQYYRKETDSYTTIHHFYPPVQPAYLAPAAEKEE